jgi:hypothetical protein
MAAAFLMISDRMIKQQHHNTSDECHENAPQVKTRNSIVANGAEDNPTDNSSNDAEEDIAQQPLTTPVDYPAGKIASDQTDQDPGKRPRSFVHDLIAGLRPYCCAQE